MNYMDFLEKKPTLYGSTIGKNYKQYIGSYQLGWSKWTNTFCYYFVGKNGKLNKNMGFTAKRAFDLLSLGRLSTSPQYGDKENYL